MTPSIQLSNGLYYNFENPDPSVITLEVVANALANICRFTGHVSRFYSVAEHCVRCSYLGPDDEALERLMHDAAEALVADMPSPMKRMAGMEAYRAADHAAEAVIAKRFNLTYPWPVSVGIADIKMLATEWVDLLPPSDDKTEWLMLEGIEPVAGSSLASQSGRPETWKRAFIRRYHELSAARTAVTA